MPPYFSLPDDNPRHIQRALREEERMWRDRLGLSFGARLHRWVQLTLWTLFVLGVGVLLGLMF